MKSGTQSAEFGRVFDHLVDSRVGIVQNVYEVLPEARHPKLFHYYSTAANTSAFALRENFRFNGGAALDKRVAMAKAMGESVERYCSALYSPHELPLATSHSADFECVPPEHFACYTDAQFGEPNFEFVPFGPDTLVRWTPAIEFNSAREVHIPAACVWMPYFFKTNEGESPIMQPISTGLACHRDLPSAMLGGLCEVIERDSFTIMWQARLSFPHISAQTLSERNFELVRRFERVGHEVYLLDITSDLGVPVVLAVCRHSRSGLPPLTLAASSSPDPEEAVRKALEELAHTSRYMAEIHAMEPLDPGESFANVNSQLAHLRFWASRERDGLADFVTKSDDRVNFKDLPDLSDEDPAVELRRVRDRLANAGFASYGADLTTPDVGALGLSVVRCIVPGLHPFFIGHQRRARGNPRLYDVPEKLGFGRLARGADNPLPHPYP